LKGVAFKMDVVNSLNLNATLVAQIFNLIILLCLTFLPIIFLVFIFIQFNNLKQRVRRLEEILMDKNNKNT